MMINSHVDKVYEVAQSNAIAKSRVAASWRRALDIHGLDPANPRKTKRICGRDLKHRQKNLDRLLRVASPKLDNLYKTLGLSGCGVLLTDAEGIIVDQRLSSADTPVFEDWGLGKGTDWSEASEGTNGIGTCIAENRSVTIHMDQHFHARNIALSCMDAPIFGLDGQIIAALDVSTARLDRTENINSLISALVIDVARQIETEYFHHCFTNHRIISLPQGDSEAPALLAVDDHDLVVGATRIARKICQLGFNAQIEPVPASDILGGPSRNELFGDAESAAIMQALARTHGNITQAAEQCGIGRATFYRRMNRVGISKELIKSKNY